jgi:hypothetical protein
MEPAPIDRTYPAWMTHPAFEAAVLPGPGGNPRGKPMRYAPVMVNTADQEAEYVAKGYEPVEKVDPRIFEPKKPEDVQTYQHAEYPMWRGDVLLATEAEHLSRFPEDFAPRAAPGHDAAI